MRDPDTDSDQDDDVAAPARCPVSREDGDGQPVRLLLTAALRVPEERAAALESERATAAEPAEQPLAPLLLRERVDAESDSADALPTDPDALRMLVAEVVREELHGVMGERVTRNMRKLVRNEVARAIASREFAARES